MDSRNKFNLDYADNPDLKEYFQRKKVGDKCRVEVEIQLEEISPDGAVATIEEIVLPDDADKPNVKPNHETPIAVIVMGGKGKAKKGQDYEAA